MYQQLLAEPIDDILADIDDLLDLYHFLVDTGYVPDLDLADIPPDPAEKETDDAAIGG